MPQFPCRPLQLSPRPRAWLIGLGFALAACVPLQSGVNQVPDININLNALKDANFVGMPAAVDTIMAELLAGSGRFAASSPIPGCALGVMEGNIVSHLKGYGVADLDDNRPFTHETPSVVGSVSKTWTALAALRLVELGLLGLEDTVGDHLPGAPAAWQNETLRQLLSHTSGLAYMPTFNPALNDEAELGAYWGGLGGPNPGINPRLVWVSYTQTPVEGFAPGETAKYSNVGYLLVGAIIDQFVSDNPAVVGNDFAAYERFVWRQVGVFDGNLSNGAQMFSQSLNEYWRQNDIPKLAKGYLYDVDTNSFQQLTFANSSLLNVGPAGWEGPAGGWSMTIGDLVRLMSAIQHDDIIAQGTKNDEMMQVYGSDEARQLGVGGQPDPEARALGLHA